ncbi:MAG: HupE/UreJ family protein [Acidobacteriaceae bacterium]|jgi:hypothetical protein|nr:HupE/UreJ family protein [Acidobacteriaceae bacterium]
MNNLRKWHWLMAVLVLVSIGFGIAPRLHAHEIPNDVTIQAFLKPEGTRLRLLIRVPLIAMRDMTWPFKAPDVLDLATADSELRNAATLWVGDEVKLFEDNQPLGPYTVANIRASEATDTSFESYDRALALVTGPRLPDDTTLSIKDGFLDVLFEYPIQNEHARFSIDPHWGRLGQRAITVVRLVLPNDTVRAFELEGDPGLIRLDPEWYQAAWRFVVLGIEHILSGIDHLLFLFCLVIPFRRPRQLLVVVSAFTVGHSITLIASAFGLAPDMLWFPPFIEMMIAASIVYMALENIVGANLHRRWIITLAFGLVHGFGFSFALRQTLQFAGTHLLLSLLSFNVGVEIGQIAVLALILPALALLFARVVPERLGTIILSALVAHTGWHWMTERGALLMQYQFTMPEMTPAFFANVLRVLMVVVAASGVWWLVGVLKKRTTSQGIAGE